jgi:hypothetical protein
VPVGTNINNLPLAPEGTAPTLPGTITGQVTNDGTTGADVFISALQDATPAGGTLTHVTIPVFGAASQPPLVTTQATTNGNPACPSGKDCFDFTLNVPASNPLVATFSSGSISFPTTPPGVPASYNVNANDNACTTTSNATTASPFSVGPGGSGSAGVLNLTGCP